MGCLEEEGEIVGKMKMFGSFVVVVVVVVVVVAVAVRLGCEGRDGARELQHQSVFASAILSGSLMEVFASGISFAICDVTFIEKGTFYPVYLAQKLKAVLGAAHSAFQHVRSASDTLDDVHFGSLHRFISKGHDQ